jgi:hypothetical protein
MKRFYLNTSLMLLALTIVTGCSSKPEAVGTVDKPKEECIQDGVIAPGFTCDPYSKGSVVALGIASMNAGNDKAMQRAEAMAVARDALARQIEVKVSNMFRTFKATTGAGIEATFDKASSDVSKQLTSQVLKGSKPIGKSWRHPETNEYFVLVGIDSNQVSDQMEKAIKSSFNNDRALYQKFLAAKAQGELERELEKASNQEKLKDKKLESVEKKQL